ncbi:MAG: T9SS C-terminal target domain-containing protein, partial [Bacteroidetes bacterium]
DGQLDLVVFERDGATFTPYINEGLPGQIKYRYAPEFASRFDSCKCVQWALLVDYNCDGDVDIFCGRGSGQNFRVYENVVYNGDSVGFVMRYDPLLSMSNTLLNLYQTRTDMPGITDIDYDGDIDIVATQNGFNRLALHRNMAMERFGRCDTLIYERETSCWGYFSESNVDNTVILFDSLFCPNSTGEVEENPDGSSRHEGTTILILDTDADSLKDVLLGDVSYSNAVAVFNGGTMYNAYMDSLEVRYPLQDSAIDVDVFPAFFHVDVNNDKSRDLLVAPNIKIGSENVNGTALYLNNGADNNVDFQFAGRSFLPSTQIDAGDATSPAFIDYNADGLKDLLLGGSYAYYNTLADSILTYELHLYKNIGSAQAPAFQLLTRDYVNVSFVLPALSAISPAAGDLDGDGDPDLLLGNQRGTLYYYRNIAPPGQPANFTPVPGQLLKDANLTAIDAGSASAPELFDIDNDGDLDLFIGNQAGQIVFYRNTGTAANAQFTIETAKWGDIQLSNEFNSPFSGFAKPRFANIDNDPEMEFLAGEETGFIEIYDNIAQAGINPLVKSGDLFGFDFGAMAAPAAAVLDTSGKLTWVVGNARGGLMLFSTGEEPASTAAIDPAPAWQVNAYPNPADNELNVSWDWKGNLVQVQLLNLLGQTLRVEEVRAEGISLDISNLASGWYLLRIQADGRFATLKVRVN